MDTPARLPRPPSQLEDSRLAGGGQSALPDEVAAQNSTEHPSTQHTTTGGANRTRHLWDRVAAVVVLLLGFTLFVTSVKYGIFQDNRPGPGLFPALMAASLVLVAGAWFVIGAGPGDAHHLPAAAVADHLQQHPAEPRGSSAPGSADAADDLEAEEPIDRAGARRITFVVLWTVVPLALMEPLGYVITMAIYITGLLTMMARVRAWIAIPGALVGAAVTGLGADALGVVLPDPLGLLRLIGA